MPRDGQVYKFDAHKVATTLDRALAADFDTLVNGSTTDTLQWCELHEGHCHDVVPVRRCFDDPRRKSEMFMACPRCIRVLKKAELIDDSKYAGLPCAEIVVPKGLSKGHYAARDSHKPRHQRSKIARSLLEGRQQSYEVTLDALQLTYLRALGLKVIPA